jgi:TrmH family RNA methyltransferase
MNIITSRDNPLLKDLRRLSQDSTAYRKLGRIWLEGDHLCRAALQRGVKPQQAVFSESLWATASMQWMHSAERISVIPDALFAEISGLESPAKMGFVLSIPDKPTVQKSAPTVVLDRVQDAGNVGSILRSASAFGFKQVLAMKGTAALWSPKVLRAGMGAHFGLNLLEGLNLEQLDDLEIPWVATSVHQGRFLHHLLAQGDMPMPCAWLMGHEGQGVSPELEARAALTVRIAQPGGEESLNVAAAAAICLHASATIDAGKPVPRI